jgi:hypothetical protein
VTEPPRTLQSLLTPGSEAERPRETPSLLDELHGMQELLDRPASRETLLAQVFEFALEAARDHHRQQVAEHAFELDERRRRAQKMRVSVGSGSPWRPRLASSSSSPLQSLSSR